MNYKETGFRALYKHFVAFMLKDNLRQCIENYPDADKANCILTCGYIDREAGLTMEVLCAGYKNGDDFSFFDQCKEHRVILRVALLKKMNSISLMILMEGCKRNMQIKLRS